MDEATDKARGQKGFLGVTALTTSIGQQNTILDPYSVLIAKDVIIGERNTFYPNVVIECRGQGRITIGDGNTFYPGTYMLCADGSITIKDGNEFGSGGCTIRANMPGVEIHIGSKGRYAEGANIMGATNFGSGSQILGNITAQGCTLDGGDDYRGPDPDERAAVLKGFGLARGLKLEKGQVVNGSGNFANNPIELQRDYHPKRKA